MRERGWRGDPGRRSHGDRGTPGTGAPAIGRRAGLESILRPCEDYSPMGSARRCGSGDPRLPMRRQQSVGRGPRPSESRDSRSSTRSSRGGGLSAREAGHGTCLCNRVPRSGAAGRPERRTEVEHVEDRMAGDGNAAGPGLRDDGDGRGRGRTRRHLARRARRRRRRGRPRRREHGACGCRPERIPRRTLGRRRRRVPLAKPAGAVACAARRLRRARAGPVRRVQGACRGAQADRSDSVASAGRGSGAKEPEVEA